MYVLIVFLVDFDLIFCVTFLYHDIIVFLFSHFIRKICMCGHCVFSV